MGSLLNERLPNCKCPGGKFEQCGCMTKHAGLGCCAFETCYPGKECGPLPASAIQRETAASNQSDRSLLNERLPNCKCPGGKFEQCGCMTKHAGLGCCVFETCYPGKECGPLPASAIQRETAADNQSDRSLLNERLPNCKCPG